MLPVSERFTFDYFGSELAYGRGRIAEIGDDLDTYGLERALVVCGSNVGANDELMDPIRAGLGDRLVGVFDETTPGKRAETAYDLLEAVDEHDPDVLVSVGGGSSIDITRVATALREDGRTLEELRAEARKTDDVEPARCDGEPIAHVTVPTTFAGADISAGGSLVVSAADEAPTGRVQRVGSASDRVRPIRMVYDPELFETTPMRPLAGSAMNGFDKGLETIYTSNATPITDATAVHGLRLLTEALPRLPDGDADAMDRAVVGVILVQFRRQTAIVHAFGHGFARRYPVQQGDVHAIVVPHVLETLLETVDGRRALLAEGLGVDADLSDDELAEAIVERVASVRDSLGLPTQLRQLEGTDREDFRAIAEFIVDDAPMGRNPVDFDPTVDEIEALLEAAW